MALVVENGTGLSNAESYASVADATTYHSNLGNASWASASGTNQEIALRKATIYLDAKYRGQWRGERILQTMSLSWPRYNVIDDDNFEVVSTAVPQALKNACMELALRALTTTLMPDYTAGSVEAETLKVGEIEITSKYSSGKTAWTSFPVIDRMLESLLMGSTLERS